MSDYTPTTDFSIKDGLLTGDPNKIIKGSDFDIEFEAIETAIVSKYDSNSLGASSGASLVGFVGGGTSATATTVQAKLREVASVKDFGATGDGTTDDAAAFNLAIAALNDGTISYLHIPEGTYVIGSALDPITADNWTIFGSGNSSTLVIKTTATPNTLSNFFTIGSTTVSADRWRISGLHFLNENTATMGTTNPIVVNRCITGYVDHVYLEDTCGFITLGTTTTDSIARRVHVSDFRVELYGPAAGTCFDIVQAYGCYYSTGLVTMSTDGADCLSIHVHPSSGQLIDSHKWNRVEFNFPSLSVKNILKMDATDGLIINQWFSDCVFDHAEETCIWLYIGAGAGATSRMNNIFFNSCRSTSDGAGPVVIEVLESREIQNLEFNGGSLITYDDHAVKITATGQKVNSSWNGVTFQDSEGITAKSAIYSDYGNIRVTGCITQGNTVAIGSTFDYAIYFSSTASGFIITGNDFSDCTQGDVYVDNLATSASITKIISDNIAPRKFTNAKVQTTDASVTILTAQGLTDESTYHVRATVVGVKSDGTQRASYEIVGTFYRTAAGDVTQQGATTVVHSIESDSNWNVVFAIATTVLQVRVTGVAGTTINWVGKMEFTQVS